jgi:peptidoglycan/xylan/chitin deacetylase (PgdA/CDA1 family)
MANRKFCETKSLPDSSAARLWFVMRRQPVTACQRPGTQRDSENKFAMATSHLAHFFRRHATAWVTAGLGLAHAAAAVVGWWAGWQWAVAYLGGLGAGLVLATLVPHCRLFGKAVRRFPMSERKVILTIDDGPTEDTEEILKLLAAHRAKAVFFLIGERAAQRPAAVRQIVAAGHAVGNHTQTHPCYWYWSYPPGRQRREVFQCQNTLADITGQAPEWFRAPAGFRNPYCNLVATEVGLAVMGWQVRGFDGVQTPVEKSLASLRRGLCPGAILLVHQGMPQSLELLRRLLEMLAADGWTTALPEPRFNPPTAGTPRANC